jgi:hypothetical protein
MERGEPDAHSHAHGAPDAYRDWDHATGHDPADPHAHGHHAAS